MRRRLRLAVGGAAFGALLLSPVGPGAVSASAAPVDDPGSFPSEKKVDRAQQQAREAAGEVAQIQARLAGATHRLHRLDVATQMAVEKYNTAVYKREQAKRAAQVARAKADEARQAVDGKRERIARFAASTYQHDSALRQLNGYLAAQDPQRLLDRMSTVTMVTSSFADAFQELQADRVVAEQLDKRAAKALDKQRAAASAAAAAKTKAQEAQDEQQQAVGAIQHQRQQLQAQLASAQDRSAKLASDRKEGLREQARERAREAARARAERQRAEERERQRQQEKQREREKQREHRDNQGDDNGGGGDSDTGGDTGGDTGSDTGGDTGGDDTGGDNGGDTGGGDNGGGGSTSTQGEVAVDFAQAQLGEPYVFGADGPDSWDCSGLTMRAWQQAGVSMPHAAHLQYWQSQPISQSELRPGDLLFWANDPGDSGTIYHVAMYIGGGQMIQAPKPGRSVEIQSMWYMGAPNFMARPS